MRVMDLQEFLSKFTESNAVGRQGNAISNAIIMVEFNGKLHKIKRMEVQEHSEPIIGHNRIHTAHRLVLKTVKESKILMPDKLMNDY
tara:strand:+ start:275 stop:535 length:261 start_codon:yes stop_codon:yes gene_type:complete